jgi:hypothetical protein
VAYQIHTRDTEKLNPLGAVARTTRAQHPILYLPCLRDPLLFRPLFGFPMPKGGVSIPIQAWRSHNSPSLAVGLRVNITFRATRFGGISAGLFPAVGVESHVPHGVPRTSHPCDVTPRCPGARPLPLVYPPILRALPGLEQVPDRAWRDHTISGETEAGMRAVS